MKRKEMKPRNPSLAVAWRAGVPNTEITEYTEIRKREVRAVVRAGGSRLPSKLGVNSVNTSRLSASKHGEG
jgi:hypothetical protein